MNKFKLLLFSLILIVFYGCRPNTNSDYICVYPRLFNKITNVIDISKDTIIGTNLFNGIVISKNSGKSWQKFGDNNLTEEMTYTDKGLLVGLKYSLGNEIPDYAKILISKDFGYTWTIVNLNIKDFFPTKIISNPKESLCVRTSDNKIYKLTGIDLKYDWTYLGKYKKHSIAKELINHPYQIVDDYGSKANSLYMYKVKIVKKVGIHYSTVLKLYNFKVNSMICTNNTIHIVGYKKESIYEPGYNYYAQYNKISGYKEYKIPGGYIHIKKTQLGNIYIMTDYSIYKEENGKIKQLY